MNSLHSTIPQILLVGTTIEHQQNGNRPFTVFSKFAAHLKKQ
jgi:hypothetical protein